MLEVCFHSSVKIALIFAPKCSKDVAGLAFNLSEGDIKTPITLENCPRREILRSTYSFHEHDDPAEVEEHFDTLWRDCVKDLERLKNPPEKIRIWLDDTPHAQCGLLFVADLLQNNDTEIHVVELPKQVKQGDCIIEYRGWFEVEPELFQTFLHLEKILTKEEVHQLAEHWKILQAENAPLRVIQNQKVISAEEDYYDSLIRKEFPTESCKIIKIIADAFPNIPMSDGFIAKRVLHFIDSGELVIIGNVHEGFYSTVVRPAK